jgi:hypothetical protein
MKTIFKPQFLVVMLLAAAATILISGSVFAQTTEGEETESGTLTTANLCQRIDEAISTYQSRITDRRSTLTTNFTTRLSEITDRKTSIEERVVAARQEAATKFEEKITELKAIEGLSEDQLTAIETFKIAMLSARETRQSAVDQARASYQNGLQTLMSDRQDDLSAAVLAYDSAVDTAFDTAKTNCSSAGAFATLRSDLKSAKNELNSVRTSTESSEELKSLMEARNTAIQLANSTFADTAKQNTDALRASLGISTDESTTDS